MDVDWDQISQIRSSAAFFSFFLKMVKVILEDTTTTFSLILLNLPPSLLPSYSKLANMLN
jgi:hypothetical protein